MKTLHIWKLMVGVLVMSSIALFTLPGETAAMNGGDGETVQGKIQGLSFITNKILYPKNANDPLIVGERAFVLVEDNDRTKYFFLPNLKRSLMSRYVGKDVKVLGTVHSIYGRRTIEVREFKSRDDSGWTSVWSKRADEWDAWHRNRDLYSH